MSDSQVILKGGNRTRWLVAGIFLLFAASIVLELLRPGTLRAVVYGVADGIGSIYGYFGDIANSLKSLVHDISDWY